MQGSLVKGNFSYSGALDPRDRSQGSDKWSDFEYNFNMRLRGFNRLDMMEEMKMWIKKEICTESKWVRDNIRGQRFWFIKAGMGTGFGSLQVSCCPGCGW